MENLLNLFVGMMASLVFQVLSRVFHWDTTTEIAYALLLIVYFILENRSLNTAEHVVLSKGIKFLLPKR